ncbi:universal stress protein [Nocardia vaccinii]|uniref:universal stress protein n=1 Tax=Nocardia vaccinii TaxID=1822 RepID=UPI000833779A|nr:universal stress protein [Nocardia vaccinii]
MAQDGSRGRIVVGVDGSDSSKIALRWAAAQAHSTGSKLQVAQVWQQPVTYGAPVPFPDVDLVELAREELQGTVAEVLGPDPDVPVVTRILEGQPAEVLLDLARDADLLVVGSHGRGAFARMLLGSVSQHCVQHASCPVVVVPGIERQSA